MFNGCSCPHLLFASGFLFLQIIIVYYWCAERGLRETILLWLRVIVENVLASVGKVWVTSFRYPHLTNTPRREPIYSPHERYVAKFAKYGLRTLQAVEMKSFLVFSLRVIWGSATKPAPSLWEDTRTQDVWAVEGISGRVKFCRLLGLKIRKIVNYGNEILTVLEGIEFDNSDRTIMSFMSHRMVFDTQRSIFDLVQLENHGPASAA